MRLFIMAFIMISQLSNAGEIFMCDTQLLSMPKVKITVTDSDDYIFEALFKDEEQFKKLSFEVSDDEFWGEIFLLNIEYNDINLSDAFIKLDRTYLSILNGAGENEWKYYGSHLYSISFPKTGARSDTSCKFKSMTK